jgi:hypothetical protein
VIAGCYLDAHSGGGAGEFWEDGMDDYHSDGPGPMGHDALNSSAGGTAGAQDEERQQAKRPLRARPTSSNKRLKAEFRARKSLAGGQPPALVVLDWTALRSC